MVDSGTPPLLLLLLSILASLRQQRKQPFLQRFLCVPLFGKDFEEDVVFGFFLVS
jgi:hypothetical protein